MRSEQERSEGLAGGPRPFSDEFPPAHGGPDRCIDVIHGVYAHRLPLVGRTVRQARAELAERMNIAPDALAVVDGMETGEDTVLREGQVLTFVKHAGEKGIAPGTGVESWPTR